MRTRIPALVLLICLVPGLWAATIRMQIPATSNIYLAGTSPSTPDTTIGGQGTAAVPYNYTPAPYTAVTFTHISGTVTYSKADGDKYPNVLYNGPDGLGAPITFLDASINSMNGISGIRKTDRIMFLVGVFLGAGAPSNTTTAVMNDQSNAALWDNNPELHPAIGQTFFIGDGRTGTGVVQQFYAPTNATRLYLGFADSDNFSGVPSYYGDNAGSFTMDVGTIIDSGVPEPGTIALFAGGLLMMAFGFRKRARR